VKGMGGAGRRREGAQTRRLTLRGGAGDWRGARRERTSKLGGRLTVARGFDRPQRADGAWVLEPGHRSSSLANVARQLSSRRRTRVGVRPRSREPSRETGPGIVLEQAFEGKKPRRAPTLLTSPPWPGYEVFGERTPGGSKASKRACRPLTGEPGVKETGGCRGHARV